jgi:outer membrane protein TolC
MTHSLRVPLLFAILAILSATPRAIGQWGTLSLDALKALAERNYEAVKINRLAVDQARLTVEGAEAARLPKLDLTASYVHLSETGKIELSLPGLPIPVKTIALGDGNVWETALTASVPLFTGFRLDAGIAMQREQQNMADIALSGSIVEVRNQVTRLFHLFQFAKRSKEILTAQRLLLANNLAVRRSLVEQGQALAIDTLQLATRMLQLDVERNAADVQRDRAKLSLQELTGLRGGFDPADEAPSLPDFLDAEGMTLFELAMENRADLKALSASWALAGHAVEVAKAPLYPALYAQASYKYGRPGVDQFRNEWMDYYTVGVRLEWNLWSWNADGKNIERQQIEMQRAMLRVRQLRTRIQTAISQLVDDIGQKRATLRLLEAQVRLEQEKQLLVQARYTEGLATSTDLIDAETSLTSALLRLQQTRIELALTATDLATTLGIEH